MAENNVIYLFPEEDSKNYAASMFLGMTEKTSQESAFHADSQLKPYNQDDLWQKTGDFSVYEKMMDDDQVSVSMQLKKDLVLNAGWEIIQGEEGQDEIIDDLTVALAEDVDTPLEDLLEEVISAYEYGFSLTEKIFKKREDGKITLKTLKTRHPDTWLIDTDEQGNIKEITQQGVDKNVKIDPRSLIHYVNKRKFQNPYGTSDLRAAYQAWFIKTQIIAYYSIFLEKSASPIPVAKYDTNAPKKAVTDLHTAIKKFQQKTALTIPKEVEIEFLQASNTGEAYTKGINIFNMFIGRSLFIPDLLGFSGDETQGGSFALGTEQIDLFLNHIERRRSTLERIVNEHIIKPIVIANYGFMDNFPKFKLRPVKERDAFDAAKIFIEAMRGKTYKPTEEEINHFRKIIRFPEGDVEFEDPINNPINPEDNPFNPPSGDLEDPSEVEDTDDVEVKQNKKNFVVKKKDLKQVETLLNRQLDSITNESDEILKFMFNDLVDQIEKKKIIKNKRVERIDDIKLKRLSALKNVIKARLRETFTESKKIAQAELFKRDFVEPIATDEFLDILEQEVFGAIGKWDASIKEGARVKIIEAIKDGKPLSEVINFIEGDLFDKMQTNVDRWARTKLTEVMNKGRVDFFEQSEVVQGYEYSAILDSRTTTICQGLDGKRFRKGTQPIPPMHFNCRSVLVPVTIFEDLNPDKKVGRQNIGTFIEQNKGEGFPAK